MAITNKELADLMGSLTAGADNTATLNAAYQLAFGRGADADGLAYWGDRLDNGLAVADLVEALLAGADKYPADGPFATKNIADKAVIVNKTEVAKAIKAKNAVTPEQAKNILVTVTDDEASKIAALVDVAEIDGETFVLTTSIKAVADAETAKSDWIESLGKIDQDLDADTKPVDASETHVNTLLDNAATNIAAIAEITLGKADYKDLEKTALQDADISTALSITQSKLDFATSAAKTGMTTLVNNANAALETYNDADKAQAKATTDYSAEVQAFLTANETAIETAGATQLASDITAVTEIVFLTDATFNTATDYSNKLLVIGDTIYAGTTAGTLTIAKAQASQTFSDLVRDTNLTAANTALKTATATETNALEALEEAVGKVYVSETGGHSLADIGTAVTAATGTGDGSISFKNTSVKVYETAADTAKGVGKTSTVATFTATTDTTAQTIVFDGVTVTVGDGTTAATAAEIASALIAQNGNFDNYTAKAVAGAGNEAKVEFVYNDIAISNSNEYDVLTSGTASNSIQISGGTAATVAVATATQVEAGDVTELSSAASKADDLNTAINNLDALEKAIADFQEARDLKIALEDHNEAIKAAKAAITNATDDKDLPGLDMNLRDLDQNATTSDDVFVFSKDAADGTIANFGKSGDDYFFFGEDYSLFALPKDKTILDNVGNVSALEIIWEQDGNDLKLYVETESFAGNASSTADIVTITLTGVNAEDVSFSDGMLTIA